MGKVKFTPEEEKAAKSVVRAMKKLPKHIVLCVLENNAYLGKEGMEDADTILIYENCESGGYLRDMLNLDP